MVNKKRENTLGFEFEGIRKKGTIAVAALVLAVTPSVASAFHYFIIGGSSHFVPLDCRPFYTPHAFSYHHSGYVPAGTQYDMNAFSYNHSGLVSNEDFWLPWGFKSQITPDDQAKYDVAKRYVPSGVGTTNRIEDVCEGPSYKGMVAARTARAEELKKEAQKRREQEGLDEFALFRGYFDTLKIPYRLAKMSSHNQTVAVHIDFPTDPNHIIEWRDDSLLKNMPGWFHTVYERRRNDFLKEGKTIVEITETSADKITSRLEEIVVRYQLQKKG